MKQFKYFTIILWVFLSLVITKLSGQTPIVVNNTPVVGTCSLGTYGNVQISVPTEALTGDNILLNITLPATAVGCTKTVKIINSSNLNFVSSVMAFVPAGTNTITNSVVFDPINGQNFNVIYKFPNGTICNNATGTFTVDFEVNCGGTITKCTATVNVKARAANYWTIVKEFVAGNLTCGQSQWRIRLKHNNPNGIGLGAYNISGTVTETTTLPIVSPAGAITVGGSCFESPSSYNVQDVFLQNCQAEGSVITNTANYNLTLGSPAAPCGTMTGAVNAVSPALASPNTSISFAKYAYANGGVFTNGCQGVYTLAVCNNGNVPWTGLKIIDNLSIPGISVTSFGLSGGWTATPTGTYTGTVAFTNSTIVLAPGACTYIYIYFTITGTGGTVTNNATLYYHASSTGAGSGGTLGGGCPGITCPVITTAELNKSASASFNITPAQAVPSIVKCNEPNPWAVPVKQVGGTIKFRIQVANSGAAPLTTVITDALTTPQNLSIIPGSVTFTYYPNQNSNYCGGLSGTGTLSTIGSWNNNVTNPQFNVTALPGNCNLWKSNILVIEFEANVLPQLSGSRINTAVMGTQTASANYSIDKTGELKIRKIADVTTVENGGTFNYILTVSNVGSTPLNNVIVTDNLPACIQQNGAVTVKKGGSPVTSSVSGSVVITINAATVINPGESFVITIPVKKVSGTNCCNAMATATAKMVPDATLLNATTPVNEPACVTSTTCCDIQNFTTTLTTLPSHVPGQFNLNINAGTVPVQEIEVSMLDYHVVYSSADCKPLNMGIFGNIFSPTTTIGGLNINNNNSQSIGWGLGTTTLVNGNIRLSISRPGVMNLDCCNGVMYFCLKVRVKNAECKVCEKIVCGRFNLKSNIVIWNPTGDVQVATPLKIKPELKELNDRSIAEQQQKIDIEEAKIQAAIERELKNLGPVKAQEFLKRLSANPKEVTEELKSKAADCCPLAAPTGGTTPMPK